MIQIDEKEITGELRAWYAELLENEGSENDRVEAIKARFTDAQERRDAEKAA